MPAMHNSTYTPIQSTHTIYQALSHILQIIYPTITMKRTKIGEIQGLSINVITINTTVDLLVCTSIQNIQEVTAQDAHLQDLKAYIIHGWKYKKDGMAQDIQKYWPIRHELVMIDGEAEKGKRIIPSQFQMQMLSQLHSNHMGIESIRLLAHKSVYSVNMNADIENTIKHCSTYREYQNSQSQEKTISHEVQAKLWK